MKHKGLTLLELICTITIIGFIVGIALPSTVSLYQRNRADAIQEALIREFQAGRSEAINLNQSLKLCGSRDGVQCTEVWDNALLLFRDVDDNNIASSTEIIRSRSFDVRSGYIKSSFSLGANTVTISPHGRVSVTGSFIICPHRGAANHLRRVTWNRLGRLYSGRDLNGDGVVDSTNGSPLECN